MSQPRRVDANGLLLYGKHAGKTPAEAQLLRAAEKAGLRRENDDETERVQRGIEKELNGNDFHTSEGLAKLEDSLLAEGLFKLRDEPAGGNAFVIGAQRIINILWDKSDRKSADFEKELAALQAKMIDLGDKLRDEKILKENALIEVARLKKILIDSDINFE